MKKFYALAAVALIAAAANAQNGAPLYITGQGSFTNGTWNPETPDEFVYADGQYTISIEGLASFKISTACGDWDLFNGGALGCGAEGYGKEKGVAKPLIEWGENTDCPWSADDVTWTIVIPGDLSTITLNTDSEPITELSIYLRGDMNSWCNDPNDASKFYNPVGDLWKLSKVNDNVYMFTCADDQIITQGETFKIATNNWTKYNFGAYKAEGAEKAEAYMMDVELDITNGSNDNCMLEEDWNGVVYLQLEPSMVFFSNDKGATPDGWNLNNAVEGVVIENNAPAAYYTLQGVRVADPGNGLFIVVKDGKASKVLLK